MKDPVVETLDRVRRIETRLTKYLEHIGFTTGAQRPAWHDGTIVLPSMDCSLKDTLAAIPHDWDPLRAVYVTHAGRDVSVLYLSQRGREV